MITDIHTMLWLLGVIAFGYSCFVFIAFGSFNSRSKEAAYKRTNLITTITVIAMFVFLFFIIYGYKICK